MHDSGDPFLCLYDLEKVYDSIEHSILLTSLHDAVIKGKAWKVISIYNNLHAVVKSGASYSSHFRISQGVQQGSILSPTFFLVVMDKLLFELNEKKAGISIYDLYLGGAAHVDDVRSIATSANTAKEQSLLISDFTSNNGLTLNMPETEVVKISRNPTWNNETVNLSNICTNYP